MSDFANEFLEEMKPVALARIKGGALRRVLLRGYAWNRVLIDAERNAGQRFTRASYFTALHEAAERMTPAEREAWRADGTLPPDFWKWVETRAASWDSLPG